MATNEILNALDRYNNIDEWLSLKNLEAINEAAYLTHDPGAADLFLARFGQLVTITYQESDPPIQILSPHTELNLTSPFVV